MRSWLAYSCASLLGIVFGVAANTPPLLGQWINLAIWAAVGILVGLFIEQPKFAAWSGILYGLFVTLAFLISGFRGQSRQLPGFMLLTLGLSIFGALCGFVLVAVTNKAKMGFRK